MDDLNVNIKDEARKINETDTQIAKYTSRINDVEEAINNFKYKLQNKQDSHDNKKQEENSIFNATFQNEGNRYAQLIYTKSDIL